MLHPRFYGPVNHCETDLEQNQSQDVKDSSFSKNTQKIVRWFQKNVCCFRSNNIRFTPVKNEFFGYKTIHSALGLGKWYRSGERKYHSHAPGCPCKKGSNFQGSNVHLHQQKSNSFYFKWQWLTKVITHVYIEKYMMYSKCMYIYIY